MSARVHQGSVDEIDLAAVRARLTEAEDTLRAIRSGEVDAVIVQSQEGERIYTLNTAEQPYRALVEQMHEGAAILTVDGDILYCNQRFAALVGLPMEEVVGSPIKRFLDHPSRASFSTLVARGHGGHRGRFAIPGRPPVDVYCSVTTTHSGGVERRNVIVADLSELVNAMAGRNRAERENRSKDEFMAALAHELRNPLGAIAGAVQILGVVGPHEGAGARASAIIAQQVHHLSRLVDDLLDVGRVAAGKITLKPAPLDLAALVSRCVSQSPVNERGNRQIQLTTESTWVDADATRLEQIVGNLLSNAIKYTERDGHIAISVTAEGQEAVLRVRDDGAGIERHLLPRVFDAFVQGDRTLNRAHGGLGIGLTLVRRLVELHGGDVSARSGGVKQGSTFEVRLPRRAAPEHRPVAGVTEVIAVKRRVLIVEDNRDAGDMYRMLLELAGHEVLLAADGPSGLEMLKSARPDIALVDIGLPGMDGYELAKRFRAEAGADRVVLVALTGYGSSNDRERSKRAGFDHHLTKPVDADALRSLLGGHL